MPQKERIKTLQRQRPAINMPPRPDQPPLPLPRPMATCKGTSATTPSMEPREQATVARTAHPPLHKRLKQKAQQETGQRHWPPSHQCLEAPQGPKLDQIEIISPHHSPTLTPREISNTTAPPPDPPHAQREPTTPLGSAEPPRNGSAGTHTNHSTPVTQTDLVVKPNQFHRERKPAVGR